jgi:putative nucleotidyltransferase with HDIG domain
MLKKSFGKKAVKYVLEDLKTLFTVINSFASQRHLQISFLLASCVILLSFILFFSPFMDMRKVHYGQYATRDIYASRNITVEDKQVTAYLKAKALDKIYPVLNYSSVVGEEEQANIRLAFRSMRDYFDDILSLSSTITAISKSKKHRQALKKRLNLLVKDETNRRKAFERMLGTPLEDVEYEILKKNQFSAVLEGKLVKLIQLYKNRWVVSGQEISLFDATRGVVVRDTRSSQETAIRNGHVILRVEDMKGLLAARSKEVLKGLPSPEKYVVLSIAQRLVKPNVTFDEQETMLRREKVLQGLKPALKEIKKGNIIIHKGEKITREVLNQLDAMQKGNTGIWRVATYVGFLVLIFFIIYLPVDFSNKNIRKINLQTRDYLFLSLLIVLFPLTLKFYQFLSFAMKTTFPSINIQALLYLFPIAAGGMFVRIFVNAETAILFSFVLAILFSICADFSTTFGLITFLINLFGAELVARCEKRSRILLAGLAAGLLGGILIIASRMVQGDFFELLTSGFEVLFAVGGGILAGVLVLGFTPPLEALFGYTTDVKLLELANMDHPLLKELILKAPGSYHHSILVASLAEAAAKDIGAHPILVRVGAYYHDIGKIKKPLYFIENQQKGENNHDKLSPSMSSLILISHVKEGVELAKTYHLGKEIIDIIQQHHGTSLIRYFYNKAKENAEPENGGTNIEMFRYPGPKPQTREAGLIMLADAVEATARTLDAPTPARINAIIQETINRIFLDGQLDECELTLKNLHQIADRFGIALMAIFHHRIDYPSDENKTDTGKVNQWPMHGQKTDRKT